MVNYNNGKVYKIEPIVEHDEGDIYIGSTTKKYLSQRMDAHRSDYKRWKDDKISFVTSFALFDKYNIENCEIILLETVNCETKDELHAREKYYIKALKCVNKIVPTRSRKEYRADNKEKIKEKSILYRNDNKEKIRITNKNYRESNLERIHEFKNRKTICQCGGSYTHCHQALHFRTKQHKNYIENNID